MAGVIAISIMKKEYRTRSISRGRSIPKMMEDAMRIELKQVEQGVKIQLPSRRMRAHTRIDFHRTPQGASAHLIIGKGVPFANVQAKWGTQPTVIQPKAPNKHLAIPLNAYAKGLANKVKSLWEYGKMLHPHWNRSGLRGLTLYYGEGKSPAFQLVRQAVVKPSVNLNAVAYDMKFYTAQAIERAFEGYDFGYASVRRG